MEKEKERSREITEGNVGNGEGEVEETESAPVVLKDLKTINIEHSDDAAVTCSHDLYLQLTIDSLDNSCEQPLIDCLQKRSHTSEHVHVALDSHPHTLASFPGSAHARAWERGCPTHQPSHTTHTHTILPSTSTHTHLGQGISSIECLF